MGVSKAGKNNFFHFIFFGVSLLHLLLFIQTFPTPSLFKVKSGKTLVIRFFRDSSLYKQIVRSEESIDQFRREEAFPSDKTRSFDRQTKARRVGTFSTPNGSKSLTLSELGATIDPFKKAAKSYAAKKRETRASNDYLPEVALGDLTHLNTIEYKYFGFYQRIRQKLEQFWGRSIHQKAQELAYAGRRIAGSDEFATALRITLDQEGSIVNVELIGTSGVRELDEAAIESFNEAGPFPNPPKGLIVDGKIILEWGFIVET